MITGTFLVTELLLCPGPGPARSWKSSQPAWEVHPTTLSSQGQIEKPKVMSVSWSNERPSWGSRPPYEASVHALSTSSGSVVGAAGSQCPPCFWCRPSPENPAPDSGSPGYNKQQEDSAGRLSPVVRQSKQLRNGSCALRTVRKRRCVWEMPPSAPFTFSCP